MSKAKRAKVWIDQTGSVKLYQVPPTILKAVLKLIADYAESPRQRGKAYGKLKSKEGDI